MPSVLIQHPLTPPELSALQNEFAQYTFLLEPPSPEEWLDVEVLYSEELSIDQLHQAPRLRWIHIPTPHLGQMPIREIEATSNLLITNSKECDVHQVGEFVMAAILAHAKNFFHWHDYQPDPKALIHSPYSELMWTLKGKILLQIGLGHIGSAVLNQAQCAGMRAWGLQKRLSFHPYCDKTYDFDNLNALLPAVDVLCIAIPRGEPVPYLFDAHRIDLMQPGSILIVIGSEGVLDEEALLAAADAGKFRGVVLDMKLPRKKGKLSPLYASREIIVTPEVARLPEDEERYDYRLFRFNFRRFAAGNFSTMRNLIRQTRVESL